MTLTPVNLDSVQLLTRGSIEELFGVPDTLLAFSPLSLRFCQDLANNLIHLTSAQRTPDIVSLAFWLQKASTIESSFLQKKDIVRRARGTIFHIAPSNVPLNFAYSLIAGLLTGNRNVIRLPSREFVEVEVVISVMNQLLSRGEYESLRRLVFLVRYERNNEINQYFSSLADVRIIWGGDETIAEVRKAKLNPRAFDITFADRYSFCVINAAEYLSSHRIEELAKAFYNDVFLFDQNACTAPHLLIWLGTTREIESAKALFWDALNAVTESKYSMQGISSIDKLTAAQAFAIEGDVTAKWLSNTGPITRISLESLPKHLDKYRGNCGLFYEFESENLQRLIEIINSKYQTFSYFGLSAEELMQFAHDPNLHGVDRIVPIGKTLDFSLTWDGYDLEIFLTRTITII